MENHTECADREKGNETVQLLKVIVHKTAGEYVPYQFPLHFNQTTSGNISRIQRQKVVQLVFPYLIQQLHSTDGTMET